MIYQTSRKLPRMISEVALELEVILSSKELHDILRSFKEPFPQSNIDGPTLSREILRVLDPKIECGIELVPYSFPWYQAWRNKKVIAFTNDAYIIHLTRYFLGVNSDLEYARTLGHETVHIVDSRSPYYFGHGDNSSSGDGETAPHIVGDICVQIYKKRKDARREMGLGVKRKGVYEYGTSEESAHHFID